MRLSRMLFTAVPLVCVLSADIVSKIVANSSLQRGVPQEFLPGLIRLNITSNTNAAFGIGTGNALHTTIAGCIIMCGIIWWLLHRERSEHPLSKLELVGCGCILGGALGNIVDRVCHGAVTDFLEFAFMSFPVFNVADVMIDVGAGLVIIGTFRGAPKERTDPDSVGNT